MLRALYNSFVQTVFVRSYRTRFLLGFLLFAVVSEIIERGEVR